MKTVWAIARYEWIFSVRNRWSDGLLAVFAAAAVAVSSAGMLTTGYASGFARTTISLLQVALYLFPLASLLVGAWGCPWLRDGGALICSQPVSRRVLLFGTYIGQFGALATGSGVGFGIAGVVIGYTSGIGGLGRYAAFVLVGLVVLAAFLSIALLIASVSASRGRALAVGLVVWFIAIVGYDLLVFALAGSLAGPALRGALIGALFGNPLDLARMVGLLFIQGAAVFGGAGTVLVQTFGEGAGAGMMCGALAVWLGVPLFLADGFLKRRDL